ncbi:MAG TPA: sigma-70 family RNA polymerase sigma factor [Opitutaceae bacterium]|nr:sigma-70 family RNA polymerase sigma factor [Opitutaceae bacterium]
MIDDATLLERYARDRSEEAFAELVRRHLTLVYSAALRRTDGDAHRAKDVAQIVFTGLARDAAKLSLHPALAGWLYAATRNAVIDLLRAERRRREREEKAHTMEEISSSPEIPADWEQLRPVLDDVMEELDDQDREAVLLRFFEGRPFASVASALRVSEDAARKRVDRALEKLGALLGRRGITSTSGALALLLANQVAIAAPANVAASITVAALVGAATATGASVAGASVAGGILTIMSTTKIVTGGAAVAVLFLGSQWITHRQVVAELALVKEENRRVVDRLAEVKTAAAENLKEHDRLAAVVGSQTKSAAEIGREAAREAGRLFIADHPESKELVRSAMVDLANSWPARVGREAGFSDEQIRQWTDLFARQKGAPPYMVRGVEPDYGEVDDREIQREKVREIVGDALYARYRELQATNYGRYITALIANRAESAGSPLTSEQIHALAGVFGKANLNDMREWDRSRKESTGLLTPEQQAIFDEEAAARRASDDLSAYRNAFLHGKK